MINKEPGMNQEVVKSTGKLRLLWLGAEEWQGELVGAEHKMGYRNALPSPSISWLSSLDTVLDTGMQIRV